MQAPSVSLQPGSSPIDSYKIFRDIASIYKARVDHARYELRCIQGLPQPNLDWESDLHISIAVSQCLRNFYLILAGDEVISNIFNEDEHAIERH